MWTFQVLVLSITAYFVQSMDPQCHDGWKRFQNSCYAYSYWEATWADAAAFCVSNKAKLAEIETSEENDFLKNIAKKEGPGGVWLGATDVFNKRKFVWVSTSKALGPFTDWYRGEPYNRIIDGKAQHCVQLFKKYNYQWDDVQCSWNRTFFCEIDASTNTCS